MWIRTFLLVMLLPAGGEMDSTTCSPNAFQCGTGNCVPKAWKCDQDRDCLDGSDEVDCGDGICRLDQFQCPDQPLCVSKSFLCDGNNNCADGSDELNCGERPVLLLAERKKLSSVDLESGTVKVLMNGSSIGSACAVDFIHADNYVYWTDLQKEQISKTGLTDMNTVEVIVNTNVSSPDGLAVDWINKHIYWTDTRYNWISVASLDGKMRKALIDTELDEPRAIAVDPNHGYIYWSDWGATPKIERCGMDGNKRETIVQFNITWPNGITIDYGANRLYWVDAKFHTIEAVNLDGTQRVTVLQSRLHIQHPFAITVFEDNLYWTDWTSDSVKKHNKSGQGYTETVVSTLDRPMGIQVFHPNRQPVFKEFCGDNNGGCSHFCFPKPLNNTATYKPGSSHYICDCPDGLVLLADGRTCIHGDVVCSADQLLCPNQKLCVSTSFRCDGNNDCTDGSDERNCGERPVLLLASRRDLRSISLDGRILKVLANTSKAVMTCALDFLYTDKYVYWSDLEQGQILRVDLNESKPVEVVVQENVKTPDGLAVDWINKHIYWTDTHFNWISVASLDGKMRKTVISTELDEPRAIAVDPNYGYIYWSDWGATPKIERCGMDGNKRETIVQFNITWPNGITIDYGANRLYWVDAKFHTIEAVNLDGTQRVTVLQSRLHIQHPFAITVFEDNLYWTDWTSDSVKKHNKSGQGYTETVVSTLDRPMGIQVFHPNRQPVFKEFCGDNNGGCSHFCFPKPLNNTATYKPGSSHYICDCPDGLVLLADGRTCIHGDVVCSADQLLCPNQKLCVSTSFRCDGNNDCTDGSDERNCGERPVLLLASRRDLRSISLDGRILKVLANTSKAVMTCALDFLYTDKYVYWSDLEQGQILRVDLNESKPVEVVVQENVKTPDGLAVDWINKHIYWTDTHFNWISVASLDGKMRKTVISTELDEPRAIAVDPNYGYIYWSDWGATPKIERCGMDGNKRETIVQFNITWPNGITIDYGANRLYWVDAKFHTIEAVNLDGTQRVTVLQSRLHIQHPFAITVFEDNLYWTDWTSDSVKKHNKSGQGYTETVVSTLDRPMGIQVFHPNRQPVFKEFCGDNNGGCSHFCFPKPLNNTATYKPGNSHYICDCPDGLVLLADGRTCIHGSQPSSTVSTTITTGSVPKITSLRTSTAISSARSPATSSTTRSSTTKPSTITTSLRSSTNSFTTRTSTKRTPAIISYIITFATIPDFTSDSGDFPFLTTEKTEVHGHSPSALNPVIVGLIVIGMIILVLALLALFGFMLYRITRRKRSGHATITYHNTPTSATGLPQNSDESYMSDHENGRVSMDVNLINN